MLGPESGEIAICGFATAGVAVIRHAKISKLTAKSILRIYLYLLRENGLQGCFPRSTVDSISEDCCDANREAEKAIHEAQFVPKRYSLPFGRGTEAGGGQITFC